MNGRLGLWTLAAVALALGSAAPGLAAAEAPEQAAAAMEPVVVSNPCGQARALFGGLEAVLQLPAPEAVEATPVAGGPPGFRSCVCSCGYLCKTDADCGPGGQCGPGITCCARPAVDAVEGLTKEGLPGEAPVES